MLNSVGTLTAELSVKGPGFKTASGWWCRSYRDMKNLKTKQRSSHKTTRDVRESTNDGSMADT